MSACVCVRPRVCTCVLKPVCEEGGAGGRGPLGEERVSESEPRAEPSVSMSFSFSPDLRSSLLLVGG